MGARKCSAGSVDNNSKHDVEQFFAFLILNKTLFIFLHFKTGLEHWYKGCKDNSKVDKLMIEKTRRVQEDYNLEAPLGGPTFVISL